MVSDLVNEDHKIEKPPIIVDNTNDSNAQTQPETNSGMNEVTTDEVISELNDSQLEALISDIVDENEAELDRQREELQAEIDRLRE
jgi:hypothetical protein